MRPTFSPRKDSSTHTASADGPLKGLRVALPPNISVRGWPTEAGSKALAGFFAVEDATIVARLKTAGAHLEESTGMSEFGLGLEGSRAGEALREQSADAELVLDFVGESRAAARRAGVLGFKPSWGLVSRAGLVGLIPSMECCGVLSGTPEVIERLLHAVAGPDDRDFSLPVEATAGTAADGPTEKLPPAEVLPALSSGTIDPRMVTIGVVKEAREGLSADEQQAFHVALQELEASGFSLREVSLPGFSLFTLVHSIVGSVEASSAAGRYDSVRYGPRAPGAKNWNEMYLLSRGAAFGSLVKSYLIQGAFFQFERYEAFVDACRIRARLLDDMAHLTAEVDVLVLPPPPVSGISGESADEDSAAAGSVGAPASLADLYTRFAPTLFANVNGQPALYVPPPPGAEHSGLQLAGPRLSDGRLLALAAHLLHTSWGGAR